MAGRPPKFETAEELEDQVKAYFESLKYTSEDVEMMHPATITGLAYHLGFCSRQSFYDYENNGEFSYTIKRSRLFIESRYELGLQGRSATGCIFALKNFGWKDKTEVENNVRISEYENVSDEDLDAEIAKLSDD